VTYDHGIDNLIKIAFWGEIPEIREASFILNIMVHVVIQNWRSVEFYEGQNWECKVGRIFRGLLDPNVHCSPYACHSRT
jgi:hypothetical protein